MRVTLLQLDTPLKSNRTYPAIVVEKSLLALNDRPVYGRIGMPEGEALLTHNFTLPESEIAFVVENLQVENAYLMGAIAVLDTPHGIILKKLLAEQEPIVFRPFGLCQITFDHIVSNYHLLGFAAIPADQTT